MGVVDIEEMSTLLSTRDEQHGQADDIPLRATPPMPERLCTSLRSSREAHAAGCGTCSSGRESRACPAGRYPGGLFVRSRDGSGAMHHNTRGNERSHTCSNNTNTYIHTWIYMYVTPIYIYIYIWWVLICSYNEVVIIEAHVQDEL